MLKAAELLEIYWFMNWIYQYWNKYCKIWQLRGGQFSCIVNLSKFRGEEILHLLGDMNLKVRGTNRID